MAFVIFVHCLWDCNVGDMIHIIVIGVGDTLMIAKWNEWTNNNCRSELIRSVLYNQAVQSRKLVGPMMIND